MPAVAINNVQGAPRSLSDALFITYAPKTPFTSRIRKGKSINQELHTYKVKLKRNVTHSGASDGQPVTVSSGKNVEVEVATRIGVFKSSPRVTDLVKHKVTVAQTTGQNPGPNTGSATHMAQAVADHLQAIKFGMEVEALADQDSQPDGGTDNGSKFRGAGYWIRNSAQTDQPVNSNVRTPSAQLYSGTLAAFSEDSLQTLLEERFKSTGASAELLGIVAPALKSRISTFNRRVPSVSNYESVIRYNSNCEEKTICAGVDFYEGDFGTVEFHAEIFLPSDQRGYLFDMDQCQMMPFGPGMEEEDLANDGGGSAKVLRAMQSWHPGDPRAHCKIAPSTETAITH